MTAAGERAPDAAITVSVIVPTRNEAPNIEVLVARLAAAMAPRDDWELLFVDDSDDGTPDAVQAEQRPDRAVRLWHRARGARPGGLAGAVQDGFAQARGSTLVVMDGDLQHPPEIVPLLLHRLEVDGADLVAGTRYTSGGQAGGLDGAWRRAVSSTSRAAVHLLVPQSRVLSDPLSGLFVLRREVVEGVDLQATGFKILLEVVTRGHWLAADNLAYRFERRHAGTSKASLREGWLFLRHLCRLTGVRPRAGRSADRR